MLLAHCCLVSLPSPALQAGVRAKTHRVSLGAHGRQAVGASGEPAVSAHGRFVGSSPVPPTWWAGDTNGSFDVFGRDRRTGKIKRLSVNGSGRQGNGQSRLPTLSSHARFIAFWSDASNLVRGDTNHNSDVFVHDRRTGKTRRVSVRSSGGQGNGDSVNPFMSAGGLRQLRVERVEPGGRRQQRRPRRVRARPQDKQDQPDRRELVQAAGHRR